MTEMICWEIAAEAVANTVCGASTIYGPCGARMVKTDHTTGMEARMLIEASRAAVGMSLADANDLLGRLVPKYDAAIKAQAAPVRMPFAECYDVDAIEPLDEYVGLWECQKAGLRAVGFDIA